MKTFNQKLIALIFVFIGVLLLLINLGVISLEIKEYFVTYYPVLIVLYGFKLLIETVIYRRHALFFSFLFLSLGGLLLLDRLNVLQFEIHMIWKLWPIIFIYFGLKLFIRKRPVTVTVSRGDVDFNLFSDKEEEDFEDNKEDFTKEKVITIGELKMNKPNWSVEPLSLKTVVGDYYFDFSKAYIPDKETKIQITGMVADLKMLVPEDLPVRIDSAIKMGKLRVFDEMSQGKSCRILYESPNYIESTRKLNIVIALKIGDVRIDRI